MSIIQACYNKITPPSISLNEILSFKTSKVMTPFLVLTKNMHDPK